MIKINIKKQGQAAKSKGYNKSLEINLPQKEIYELSDEKLKIIVLKKINDLQGNTDN